MKTEKIEDQKYENISVPYFEGYRCVGYIPTRIGQYFLKEGELICADTNLLYEWLTYEKILPKRYVFEETGEFRQVKTGELCLSEEGTISRWYSQYPSLFEHKILRKVDEGQN